VLDRTTPSARLKIFQIAEYLLVRRRVFVKVAPHRTASYGRQLASRIPGTLSWSERQGPA
jgi:hypothetical protein